MDGHLTHWEMAGSGEKVPYGLSRCHTKRRIFLLVWHRLFLKKFYFLKFLFSFFFLFFFFLIKKIISKSRCHTKRRMGASTHARPSFGMTTTQAIRLGTFLCDTTSHIEKCLFYFHRAFTWSLIIHYYVTLINIHSEKPIRKCFLKKQLLFILWNLIWYRIWSRKSISLAQDGWKIFFHKGNCFCTVNYKEGQKSSNTSQK